MSVYQEPGASRVPTPQRTSPVGNADREDLGRDGEPIVALGRGIAAGLAATLVLSALSRILPGLWNTRSDGEQQMRSALPADPHDLEKVREWQARSQSPAAFQPRQGGTGGEVPGPPGAGPAGALTQPQGPGPEGLAEQFAFKVASGVFNRDISAAIRPVGFATHLAYGSAWGALYGILKTSYQLRAGTFGPLYGLIVYGVGPAFLVPAMKIMPSPRDEKPERTFLLILGHLAYGLALAEAFAALRRRGG